MFRRCIYLNKWIGSLHGRIFHTNNSKILYSSFDKDLPNPSLPTPLNKGLKPDTDILLEQLRKSKTLDRILELSSSHLDVMNAKHMVTSLEIIHDLNKSKDANSENLLENRAFQLLCSRLMKIIRLLDPEDLVTTYKVLNFIGIRNNTYVMQSILKMIGNHLNDMDISQLTFLSFLLSKQRHNQMIDGLRLAIPLVLQVQLEQQLDSDNMTQVTDCLNLACKSRLKPATIQKVINTILDKANYLSPDNALTVIFSLFRLEMPVDGYKELINYSFKLLSQNMDLLDCRQILPLVRMCRSKAFCHDAFFFGLTKKVVTEEWNLQDTWNVLRPLHSLNFVPPVLVDHLAKLMCNESETFITSSVYSPLACVEILSKSCHRPAQLSKVLDVVCAADERLKEFSTSPVLLIKFASCLALLGRFPADLMSRVLDEEYLFGALSISRKMGKKQSFEQCLLSLLWSLMVFDMQDKYPFPQTLMKSLTASVREQYVNYECPLRKFIENGLGGPQFLQSGVLTPEGLFIDHVLGMRSGNYPVSLSSSESSLSQGITFIDDIYLPVDAKMVAIVVAHEKHYCNHPEVLVGWMDIKIKALVKRKLFPVIINYSIWKNLPDREKIPYLMQEIKQAVQVEDCGKTDTLF